MPQRWRFDGACTISGRPPFLSVRPVCNTRVVRDIRGTMERFEQIYEEHAPAVRAYVRRRSPESIVDDVVADVFVVCLRRIDDVPRNALPWLYGVARKTLANERRKRRPTSSAADVAYEPEPVGDAGLAAAFAQLGDGDREILRLVAWEGLPL